MKRPESVRCENCMFATKRKDIENLAWFDVEKLVAEFPMAFAPTTLKVLCNELSR